MKRLFGALALSGSLVFCGTAFAQAAFMCGNAACDAFDSTSVISSISNLIVGNTAYDVTFTDLFTPTPFAFSTVSAVNDEPLTGADAANALNAFYTSQQGPTQLQTTDIVMQVAGITGPVVVNHLVTAIQPDAQPGIMDMIVDQPFLGGLPLPKDDVFDLKLSYSTATDCCAFGAMTVWAPVAAPEIDPASAVSALTLLFGCLAILRHRRGGLCSARG